jgi:aminotransferase EvaB
MESVSKVAKEHGLKVLEDCAQSHGATRDGVFCGAMADLAAFSFYPTKVLGAYGDAGLVVTQDEALAARVRRLRMYGMEREYYSEEHGYNSRLDEVQAAILLGKLARLDGYLRRRRAIAQIYTSELADTPLQLPCVDEGNTHAYFLYVARHPRREDIIAELARRDIMVNVSYRWPIHTMPAYEWLGYHPGDLPQTEQAMAEIFSLPMYPTLTDDQVRVVCGALREILDRLPSRASLS